MGEKIEMSYPDSTGSIFIHDKTWQFMMELYGVVSKASQESQVLLPSRRVKTIASPHHGNGISHNQKKAFYADKGSLSLR